MRALVCSPFGESPPDDASASSRARLLRSLDVLDEVEAALDDVNLGRLLGVLEELRESSQLIIITHQKRTMEIADALYGVSMREDGISAVVGQRLAEKE